MKINILGTGDGVTIRNYNTCFTLSENGEHFLVDCGGGNGILKSLAELNIDIKSIKNIFISHTHSDHIVGIVWILRMICREFLHGNLNENNKVNIWGNDEVISSIIKLYEAVLPPKFCKLIGTQIILNEVKDNDSTIILNKKVTFFDIHAAKVKQFGFYMNLENDDKFTFIGDECCTQETEKYVQDSKWLFADALLAGEYGENYNPMEKHHHSTVKYSSQIAQRLNVKNLILSHIKDEQMENRKQFFTEDAHNYFDGNVYVPYDLEVIEIK